MTRSPRSGRKPVHPSTKNTRLVTGRRALGREIGRCLDGLNETIKDRARADLEAGRKTVLHLVIAARDIAKAAGRARCGDVVMAPQVALPSVGAAAPDCVAWLTSLAAVGVAAEVHYCRRQRAGAADVEAYLLEAVSDLLAKVPQ